MTSGSATRSTPPTAAVPAAAGTPAWPLESHGDSASLEKLQFLSCRVAGQRMTPARDPKQGDNHEKIIFHCFSLSKTRLKTFRQLPWSFCTSLELPRPLPTHFTIPNFHIFRYFPDTSIHLFRSLFPIFRTHQPPGPPDSN